VILTDTGPLVALINRNDPNHATCVGVAKRLPGGPLISTWPCFTEAMYLLHRAGGYLAQKALWRLWTDGRLVLHDLSYDELKRMFDLMQVYSDLPMDLADASVVSAGELLKSKSLFTLDSDFRIYRLADGSVFELIP